MTDGGEVKAEGVSPSPCTKTLRSKVLSARLLTKYTSNRERKGVFLHGFGRLEKDKNA